jgi:hypothetical protein
MRWVPQCSKSSENPSRSDRGIILGTGIPNNHLITQRRGPSEWSSCGIAIVGIAACPPGLNSARAAAACRSVRDAVMQVSLRLQDCQEHCSLQSAPRMQVQVPMLDPSSFFAGHQLHRIATPGCAAGVVSGPLNIFQRGTNFPFTYEKFTFLSPLFSAARL